VLTDENIKCIERVLAADGRVELVPNQKAGTVKVLAVERKEVKAN
jgi:hypothetical protein